MTEVAYKPVAVKMHALRIQVVERLQELEPLADQWVQLVSSCEQPSAFFTLDWYRCWWEAFGINRRLSVICALEDERLIGAVLLCAEEIKFRGLNTLRLQFPLNGVTGEAGFIVPSARGDVLEALLNQIGRQNWDLLELRRIPCQWPQWSWLLKAAAKRGYNVTTRADNQVPIIRINGDWEEFLATRSKSFRKTIRRRLKRIEENPEPVKVVRLTDSKEILAALPDVFEVSSHSWKAQRGQALSDQPRAREFYRLLSTRLAKSRGVDLWMLYVGSTPVAFEYHLRNGHVVYPIRADFDMRFSELSPGAHLEHEILRNLHQDPTHLIHEYNTCADGYAYERKWTDLIRPQGRLWIFRPNLYGRLLHLLSLVRRPGGEIPSQASTTPEE